MKAAVQRACLMLPSSLLRRSYAQCCNVCYPLFLFIILAACVMACAGLIWMQIALKEDLDSLKEKLQSSESFSKLAHTYCNSDAHLFITVLLQCLTVESSQKVSSSEIPKLSEDLKNKQRMLDDIQSGDKGLGKLWSNLTEMNRKVIQMHHQCFKKVTVQRESVYINLC